MSEKERDKSAEEREKNPLAPEETSREKREKAIGRRRFMGLTFKAVVGGVGLTLFAQTRDARANCTSYNVCDEAGENICATYNSCTGSGADNTCSADHANQCEEMPSAGEYNLCADSAANSCTAGDANICYDDSDNSCRAGATNGCSAGTANICRSGAVNDCGAYPGTSNTCSSGTYANTCEDTGTSNVCSGTNDCSPASSDGCTNEGYNDCTGTNTCSSNSL